MAGIDDENSLQAPSSTDIVFSVLRTDSASLLHIYCKNVEKLIEMHSTDALFGVLVLGGGVDGIPATFQGESRDFPPLCHQLIYYHKGSAVMSDSSVEYKASTPLLFHTEPTTDDRHVRVSMSTRTYNHIMKNDYDWPLQESVILLQDNYDLPKFYLSADKMAEHFRRRSDGLVLTSVLSGSELQKWVVDLHDQQYETSYQADWALPGIRVPQWPAVAQPWLYRRRASKWLPESLLQEVADQGCHLVPACHPESIRDMHAWRYDFGVAKKRIMNSLNDIQKEVLFTVTTFVAATSGDKLRRSYDIAEAAYFWTLDSHSCDTWLEENIVEAAVLVMSKLEEYLSAGHCPDYFLPQSNLFADLPAELLQDLYSHVTEAVDKPDHLLHTVRSDPIGVYSILAGVSMDALSSLLGRLFNETLKIRTLQLYARLHFSSSVDACIRKHRDVLTVLESSAMPNAHARALENAVKISLGGLYLVQALRASIAKDRRSLVMRGQRCLHHAQETPLDAFISRVKMASYALAVKDYDTVVDLMSNLPDISRHKPQYCSVTNQFEGSNTNNSKELCQSFEQWIWSGWVRGTYGSLFVMSKTEKPLLPAAIAANLGLCGIPSLGMLQNPLAQFDPQFFSMVLLTLALINLGQPDAALQQIEKLEIRLDSSVSGVDEKLRIASLNILADCYKQLGFTDKHVALLRQSQRMLGNPRNPALWELMKVQGESYKRYIQTFAGFVLVSFCAAMIVKYFRVSR